MKRFRFRLEPMLRLRQFRERQAQQRFVQAQAEVAESERRLQQGSELFKESADVLDEKASAGMNISEYRIHRNHLTAIDRALEMERRRQRKLIQVREKRQQELAKKSKEKKMLENLREHKKDAYYQEVAVNLQKEIDDMVTVRKAREIMK